MALGRSKKVLAVIAVVVFCILLSVLIVSLEPVVIVTQRVATGEQDPAAHTLTRETVQFVNGGQWTVDLQNAYTEPERSHLEDVRRIFAGVRFTVLVLAAAFLFLYGISRSKPSARKQLEMRKQLNWALVILVVLGTAGALFFEPLFNLFHELFFKAGTWQFQGSASIIRLFPEVFWTTIGAEMWCVSFVLVLVLRITNVYEFTK